MKQNHSTRNNLQRAAAIVFWLLVWQIAAMALRQKLLLASPISVLVRLCTIWREAGFLASVSTSFTHIAGGFLLAFVIGSILAILAGRARIVEILLAPLMVTVKSVPVASFIIICLIWLTSSGLSTFISFLMVLPVIYNNVLGGIHNVDPQMLEAAAVFRVPWGRRFHYLWLPTIKGHLLSGCKTALGLAWKAGIAAEVIGLPSHTIGEALYRAKISFETVDLFAWTVIIVLISVVFEKIIMALLKLLYRRLESE